MIGKTVAHYKIVGRLGVGGMGVVYDAEDQRLGRHVALKFLPEELTGDPDAARRLKREAQIIALLNHPRICTIYDVNEHDGRAYIAMERLLGTNLKTYMARRTLETEEILDISSQIAEALEAAHAKGIIHRDIKPGNIFVSQDRQVKVLDFGLARRVAMPDQALAASMEGSTIQGRPIGTASYMAPERILQLPLDPRCDLFSLGVVMYEMATGRLPFAGASPAETVTNVLEKEPVPATSLSPARPGSLDILIARLIAKRADERFPSAAILREEIARLQRRARTPMLRRILDRLTGGATSNERR